MEVLVTLAPPGLLVLVLLGVCLGLHGRGGGPRFVIWCSALTLLAVLLGEVGSVLGGPGCEDPPDGGCLDGLYGVAVAWFVVLIGAALACVVEAVLAGRRRARRG